MTKTQGVRMIAAESIITQSPSYTIPGARTWAVGIFSHPLKDKSLWRSTLCLRLIASRVPNERYYPVLTWRKGSFENPYLLTRQYFPGRLRRLLCFVLTVRGFGLQGPHKVCGVFVRGGVTLGG